MHHCRKEGRLTLKRPFNPLHAARSKPKQRWPPDANSPRAKTQGLDYVGPAPDPAIDPDFNASKYLGTVSPDFEESVQSRRGRIQRPAAMVGKQDGADLGRVLGGQVRVFVRLDALENDG